MGSTCLKPCRTLVGFALSVVEFATAVCAGKQKDGLPLVLFIKRLFFQPSAPPPNPPSKRKKVDLGLSSIWPYFQISKLGFKSVAHYLIETRRLQSNLDQNVDAPKQVSAKRSLPFSDIEIQSKGLIEGDSICAGLLKSQLEVKSEDGFKIEKENTMRSMENTDSDNQVSARQSGSVSFLQVDHEVDDLHGLSKPQSGDKTGDQLKAEKEKEPPIMHEEHDRGDIMGSQPKLKKRALPIEPNSIAGRLRQRHRKGNGPGAGDEVLRGVSEKISDVKQALNYISSENNVEKDREMHSKEINKHDDDNIAPERGSELKRKPAPASGPSPDGIAGRLRSRRKTT